MKNLITHEIIQVSGGSSQESTQVQNGYLTSTLHIPPHEEDMILKVYFELEDNFQQKLT